MQYFSAETFRFLDDLNAHRDKAWFEANRDRYESNLLGPLRSAVGDIGPALREHIPDCEIRPNVNRTITRINRDMRFARGQSPYKNNMLALFYREGRKKEDAQLFVGLQPDGVWAGLYVPPPLLSEDAPMAAALGRDAARVVALGREVGLGASTDLIACKKYGEIDRRLDATKAESFLAGPHLCALRTCEPAEVAADAPAFLDRTRALLVGLVPLWEVYSGVG